MGDEPPQTSAASDTLVASTGDEAAVPHEAATAPRAASGDIDAASANFEQLIHSAVATILGAFETKLAYDASKQLQIDRLHEELQQLRSNQVARAARPLVHGLIRLHDDMGKLLSIWRVKPASELSAARFFSTIEGLQEDVEIVLGQNGVVAFRAASTTFDPRLQRVLKVVPTDDPTLAGTVAETLRPGFEQGSEVLEKERVAFFELGAGPSPAAPVGAAQPPAPQTASPAQEN